MQKLIRYLVKSGLTVFLLLSFSLVSAYAHIPHLIRYKGNIKELLKESEAKKEEAKEEKDKDGKTYSLTFRIYNLEVGGEPLWIEAHPEVLVEKQEFEVLLGSVTPLDLKFNQDYWLSIEIDSQGEIIPRERITSVGYAYMSDDSYKLGGRYADDFALFGHSHIGEDVVSPVAEAINADTVDGLHADQIVGIKDHGLLEGLSDDDHLQYLNNLRADERYAGTGWDGLTKLKTAQDHIADINNPHQVTLEQLGHIDNNPEEEAPTATERGEPTGTEIQGWADDIMSWGHSNLVANLNADMVDGLHATGSSNPLPNTLLALGADGKFPASVIPPSLSSGLWTDAGSYIYPNNAGSGFQIDDTGNLIVNGKVGIGTTNPQFGLDINGATFTDVTGSHRARIYDDTPRSQVGYMCGLSDWSHGGDFSYYGPGYNGGAGSELLTGDSVILSSASNVANGIRIIAANNGSHNAPIIFATGLWYAAAAERMRIASSGNVGIGTTNPQSPLHVANAKVSLNLQDIEHLGSDPGYGSYIKFTDAAGETVAYLGDGGSSMLMQFRTMIPGYSLAFGSGQNYQLVLDPSGYVGIGTANPKATLDVNGDLSVNGPIYQRGAVLHADYVFEPDYKLESIDEHAKFMWQERHLKAVPKAAKAEDGQEIVEVGARNRGILEELEKAHIYIAQLNERLKQLETKLAE